MVTPDPGIPDPEVGLVQHPGTGAYHVACARHGVSAFSWWSALDATYDAIGHLAAHHPRTGASSE